MLEVPAAGLAAQPAAPSGSCGLKVGVSTAGGEPRRGHRVRKVFHAALVRATGSPIVEMLSRPVFEICTTTC